MNENPRAELREAGSGDGYAKVMSDAFIKAEMELFAAQAKEVDIIATTALIRQTNAEANYREMVDSMKAGSVIVDLAAQNGGNCEYVVPGSTSTEMVSKVIGYTNLPAVPRRNPHSFTVLTSLIC
ncbi:hypothetical protein ACULNC_13305 [Shigella flexneri]